MQSLKSSLTAALTGCLLGAGACAADVLVESPYARAVPPTAENSAAFMVLNNNSGHAIKLVAASSGASKVVELHNHINDKGVMRMRRVPAIVIPAHGSVRLKPGSFHVMLIGLKQPLKAGDPVRVTLKFANGEQQTVDMRATRIMPSSGHTRHLHH